MYQVDIFDKDGAILTRATFNSLTAALIWMVAHRTGNMLDSLGYKLKEPVEWELTKIDMKMHHKLLNIVEHGAA